ncbi:MAG: hypothetical protein EOQ39_18645 [Mesorhizobium sp.]|uniref:hypothetical protein n=1 Tax=Mesorhizobium sp. TaxID=1871066 RepID=UPI000FE8E7DE|nr:hypothetical protein [Mesorhizobium sp.]RWB08811.1 MAG: hypothetical protein EOQ37_04700 [Mesorhizobium sp.]RWB13539.1 MAG: hypothetical protein EOQ39_18645 [Mesorhizobium sp.]
MLYFDIETQSLYRKPTDGYESFTPTLDLEAGYLVFVEYTTYDSNGSDHQIHHEIVDLYPDAEAARVQAKLIAQRGSGWQSHRREHLTEPVKADGSKVYEHWHNWGQSFEQCVVLKVKIADEKEITREIFR